MKDSLKYVIIHHIFRKRNIIIFIIVAYATPSPSSPHAIIFEVVPTVKEGMQILPSMRSGHQRSTNNMHLFELGCLYVSLLSLRIVHMFH